ncbi:MAG TPA: phage holin family protein [Desulfuromonadales bacterium]|nr:phage holin family protein [Desulfuromonadales bacterium]
MKGLFIRWLILTLSILAAAYLFEGIEVSSFFAAFFAAAVLGILNAFFRPVLILLTLPINLLTLGLFTFVVNALLLLLTSSIISGFHVQGFWSAVFGSLVISVVSWLLTSLVNDQGRIEVIVLRRRGKDHWE